MHVRSVHTIQQVKELIFEKGRVEIEKQRLFFNGRPLDDNKRTLQEYGIDAPSKLSLVIDPFGNDAPEIEDDLFAFDVRPFFTIRRIKELVQQKNGVEVDKQRLLFRGQLLKDNNKTLEEYGIYSTAELTLEIDQSIRRFGLKIRPASGKLFVVSVRPLNTVGKIKNLVQNAIGVEIVMQRLLLKGRLLADDQQTLKACGIDASSELTLELGDSSPTNRLDVRTSPELGNDLYAFDVRPFFTIRRIKELAQQKTGVEVDKQRLLFRGQLLDDDTKTLEECGIYSTAELTLELYHSSRSDSIAQRTGDTSILNFNFELSTFILIP